MGDLDSKLIGVWSHGVIHGYYGGSHDFRLVLMADGVGSYCHDGWWVYRYALFRWGLVEGNILRLHGQRYRINYVMMRNEPRLIQVEATPIRLDFDSERSMERLIVPFKGEPNDFYLVSRDPNELASQLHEEYLHGEA